MKTLNYLLFLLILMHFSCAKDNGIIATVSVDFLIKNNNANAPALIEFENKSKFANGFVWYFGDGDTATTVHATHTYNLAGNYNVVLKAFTDKGIITVSKTVNIINANPIADFNYTMPKPFVHAANCQFSNTSQNAVSYYWQFGDGTVSSASSPTHQYINSGTFTVRLAAYSGNGDSSILTKQIKVKSKADSVLINQVRIVNTATLFAQMYPLDASDDPDYLVAFGNWIDTSKKRTYIIWNNKSFPLDYNLQSNPIYLPVAVGSASPLINKVFILDHDITYEQSVDELDLILADYTKVSNPYPDEIELTGSTLGETTLKLFVTWK